MIRSEKTRQFIIEQTASIFNKKGYTGTYLSDLTTATGLTKGSIYGNFKDKNEVAVEAFRYNYRNLSGTIMECMAPFERADEKLIAFLNSYKANHIRLFEEGGCAVLNTSVDADDGNELLKNEARKALQNWQSTIVNIIERGIVKNELKQVNASDFALKMIAMIEGSIMLAKILNDPDILARNMTAFGEEVKALSLF